MASIPRSTLVPLPVLLLPAVLLVPSLTGCRDAALDTPRDLVVVSLDTVRRDHLSFYGYPRPTSPELERLAARSAVFEQAITQDTNTNPAHATLFTGLYPHQHGNEVNGHLLRAGVPTLAERLAAAGFATGAFVSGAPMKAAASRLDRGFERYDDDFADRRRDGRRTTERAIDWWRAERSRRRFLFLHLWDAHGPYEPDAAELELFRSPDPGPLVPRIPSYQRLTVDGRQLVHLGDYVDRYDALIRRLDGLVARVVAQVDLDRTLLVVLADHGETLGERYHMLDHGAQVYDEQIRIPLLVAGPGIVAGRRQGAVELVDLMPTLLGGLGVAPPAELPGRDLAEVLAGGPTTGKVVAFSAARADSARFADRGYELVRLRRVLAVRTPEWKLILYPGRAGEIPELFDLRRDPDEHENVVADHPDQARRLFGLLAAWHPRRRRPIRTLEVADELRQQLRSLGYLD